MLNTRQEEMLEEMKASAAYDIEKFGEYDTVEEALDKIESMNTFKHSVYKATEEYGGKYVICEDKWLCGLIPLGFALLVDENTWYTPPTEIEKRFREQ